MRTADNTSIASGVVEGGVTAAAVAFLQKTVMTMIPFFLPAIFLVALDLHLGIKAAKHRYKKYKRDADRVTFSRALRGTVGKCFEFLCWIIIASSLTVAFEQAWIEWATLGLVYANEIASVIGNYLCTKDIEFSLLAFIKNLLVFVTRWIGNKIGIVTDDVSFDDVLKPAKQKRNEKGQFVSNKKK